jgi:hypothetical protein
VISLEYPEPRTPREQELPVEQGLIPGGFG